jgi:transcriptional regulator with XRE-family HTH domain
VELHERIRDARKQRGLSQESVARRANLSLKGYGDLERGDIPNPHLLSVLHVARALDLPLSALLGEDPKAEAPSPPEISEEERRVGVEPVTKQYRMAWRGALHALADRWASRVEEEAFTLEAVDEFFLALWDISSGVSGAIEAERRELTAFMVEGMQRASTSGARTYLRELQDTGLTPAAARLLDVADDVYAAARQRFENAELVDIEQHYRGAREALSVA